MHRSGTSCLTGIMQGLGVELGEVFTENLFNKRGNRENGRIVVLNDAVLRHNNAAWNQPLVVSNWTLEMEGERDRIINELSSRPATHWGFKDTRTLFTLPFWLEGMETPRFIGTYRHPQRVALSLNHRDQSPLEYGWELWYRYNTRLLELSELYHFALTDFDQPDEAYLDDVLAKLVQLGLDSKLVDKGREFFDPKLRNQTGASVDDVQLPAKVTDLYERLRNYGN
jgi:hypothetical protein